MITQEEYKKIYINLSNEDQKRLSRFVYNHKGDINKGYDDFIEYKKEIQREYVKCYRERYPEREYLRKKKWQEENRDKVKEQYQRWKDKYPEKVRDYARVGSRKRRINKANVIEKFTEKEWKEKLLNTEGVCQHCKKYVGIEKLTMEHTLPISFAPEGFVYTIENIIAVCRSCNTKRYWEYKKGLNMT